jgi:hypothetical protein
VVKASPSTDTASQGFIGDIASSIVGQACDNVAKSVNGTVQNMGDNMVSEGSKNLDNELHKASAGVMDSMIAQTQNQIQNSIPFGGH